MSSLDLGTSFLFNTDFKRDEIIDTGSTWMGRKVYVKIVRATYSSTSGTEATYAHGISQSTYGYYQIIALIGTGTDTHPYFYPLNYYNGNVYACCVADRTNLFLRTTQSNLLGKTADIAIVFVAY